MRFHTDLKPNNYIFKKSLCTETDQNEPFSLSKCYMAETEEGTTLPQGSNPKQQSRISGDTLKKLHAHAPRPWLCSCQREIHVGQ